MVRFVPGTWCSDSRPSRWLTSGFFGARASPCMDAGEEPDHLVSHSTRLGVGAEMGGPGDLAYGGVGQVPGQVLHGVAEPLPRTVSM
jgi:hypothetical protein